jgi:hypothetical protein
LLNLHHKPADVTDWSGSVCVAADLDIHVPLPLHAQMLVYVLRHLSLVQATQKSEPPRRAVRKTLCINDVR